MAAATGRTGEIAVRETGAPAVQTDTRAVSTAASAEPMVNRAVGKPAVLGAEHVLGEQRADGDACGQSGAAEDLDRDEHGEDASLGRVLSDHDVRRTASWESTQ